MTSFSVGDTVTIEFPNGDRISGATVLENANDLWEEPLTVRWQGAYIALWHSLDRCTVTLDA